MSDPKSDLLTQAAMVTADILTGNYPGALAQSTKLAAMLEAYVVPPIDAASLNPSDRAEVDAAVDAEITKP